MTSATIDTKEAEPVKRILPEYEVYCPACTNARTKIYEQAVDMNDVAPCRTCRPDDYNDFVAEREKQSKASKSATKPRSRRRGD
jgi:hypothetical protein